MQTNFTSPHVRKSSSSTIIRVGAQVVGNVKGDIFFKSVDGSRHFLRKPPAIALDLASLYQAEQAGAQIVIVKDRETGATYKATLVHIRNLGFELDRGYGRQIALPLEGWTKTQRGQFEQLALFRS